jgi:hypothetical protein
MSALVLIHSVFRNSVWRASVHMNFLYGWCNINNYQNCMRVETSEATKALSQCWNFHKGRTHTPPLFRRRCWRLGASRITLGRGVCCADCRGRRTHISVPCQPVRTNGSRRRYKQTAIMHERHKIIFPCGNVRKMEETQLTTLV